MGTTKNSVPAKARSEISRRAFVAAATAAGAVSWTNLTIINKASAQAPLRVLAWPGYDEKPVVGQFEEANKVKVEFKNYIGGEQMLQFYAQTPKGTFDAIISDAEYVQKFVAQNAVVPLKKADFPHLKEFHPAYQDFAPLRAPDGKTWGIGTRFSFYGISYNTKYVSDEEASSWSNLFLPKFKNKMVMFDWYLPNMSNASLAVLPNNPTPYDISATSSPRSRSGCSSCGRRSCPSRRRTRAWSPRWSTRTRSSRPTATWTSR